MTKVSKFKKGDRVAVLDADIRGVVTSINDMIKIVDDTGFSYDYEANELVLIEHDQQELSKFADINNPMLMQKINGTEKRKKSEKIDRREGKVFEVDLHIEKLVKSHKGLDNYDIMLLQMDTAERKLQYAIKNRIPRIVFIHGVGEGVLQKELKYLLNRYDLKSEPASYKKYGLGASEVYIPQNHSFN